MSDEHKDYLATLRKLHDNRIPISPRTRTAPAGIELPNNNNISPGLAVLRGPPNIWHDLETQFFLDNTLCITSHIRAEGSKYLFLVSVSLKKEVDQHSWGKPIFHIFVEGDNDGDTGENNFSIDPVPLWVPTTESMWPSSDKIVSYFTLRREFPRVCTHTIDLINKGNEILFNSILYEKPY